MVVCVKNLLKNFNLVPTSWMYMPIGSIKEITETEKMPQW
jgi:hypothetical protein